MILAGGIGSRFWPASTPTRPKQILPLASERPLVADTVERIRPLIPLERLRVLTGDAMVAPIRSAVPELQPDHFLVEPRARGTAPVLVWAAHALAARDPDAIMISLHADHVIRPEPAFRALVASAAEAARSHDRLFTVGIRPTRPETGYGYIRLGAALDDAGAYAVHRFVEKPDQETAQAYVEGGEYLWNSGIFVWRAGRLLEEVAAHTPELSRLLPLLDRGDVHGYFDAALSLSIDHGVLERSRRIGVMEATFEWDDVGTWDAAGRTRPGDARGNVVEGEAALREADRCVVWNETGEPVVVFGAKDLVVVRREGVTLVLPRDRAADLKKLLDSLPDTVRGSAS
ncbi:MAG: mannose-1-phosphate guanylyltransferase [Gemmatimonadota bacterium]